MSKSERCLIGYIAFFLENYIERKGYSEYRAHSNEVNSISIALKLLNKAELKQLAKSIIKYLKKNISKAELKEEKEIIDALQYVKIAKEIHEHINDIKFKDNRHTRKFKQHVLKLLSQKLILKSKNRFIQCVYNTRLNYLAKIFNLTDLEKLIITYHASQFMLSEMKDFGLDYNYNTEPLSKLFACKEYELIKAVDKNHNLKKFLLELNKNGDAKLDPLIADYLQETSTDCKTERYFYQHNTSYYNIESFNLENDVQDTLTYLLSSNNLTKNKKGLNILFYGKTGTGKTELTKSLANYCNKKLYFINEKFGDSESSVKMRLASLYACLNFVSAEDSIIVIDEADSILNTMFSFFIRGEQVEKGALNKLLETNNHKIIWITNNNDFIEKSILRRFCFSLEFKDIDKKQRLNMWKNLLVEKQIVDAFTPDEINEFGESYKVNTGGISQAISVIDKKDFFENKKVAVDRMKRILYEHQKLVFGETKKNNIINNHNYCLEGLNIDKDLNQIKEILIKFYEAKNTAIKNMNVLLSGPPGTGKTEFVRYLGRSLSKDIISRTASTLISMYLGETEKLISSAFEEAERTGSILFIDEADSFFTPRESATRSWELTQTNEILYQMENFRGVLICATNFRDRLDHASIRRFNFKVNFDYLNNYGKKLFFNKLLLGESNNINKKDEENINTELEKINYLTPGDFKVVLQKNFYLENINSLQLLEDLRAESKSKFNSINKKIGFCL